MPGRKKKKKTYMLSGNKAWIYLLVGFNSQKAKTGIAKARLPHSSAEMPAPRTPAAASASSCWRGQSVQGLYLYPAVQSSPVTYKDKIVLFD